MVLKLFLKKVNLFMFLVIPIEMILEKCMIGLKPQCAIPVHGEHRHMIEHMKFANEMKVPHPVQVENGDIVKLFPGKPHVFDKAPSGRLYLDGNISVEEDLNQLKIEKI